MLFVVAGCLLFSAIILFFGLKWGRPTGNVRPVTEPMLLTLLVSIIAVYLCVCLNASRDNPDG
jgi:hypothetical protein